MLICSLNLLQRKKQLLQRIQQKSDREKSIGFWVFSIAEIMLRLYFFLYTIQLFAVLKLIVAFLRCSFSSWLDRYLHSLRLMYFRLQYLKICMCSPKAYGTTKLYYALEKFIDTGKKCQ